MLKIQHILVTIFLLFTQVISGQTKIDASIYRNNDDTTKFVISKTSVSDSEIFISCRLELMQRMKSYFKVMDFDHMALEMINPVKISIHSKVTVDDTVFHKKTYTQDSRSVTSFIKSYFSEQSTFLYMLYKSDMELYRKSFLMKFYTERGQNFINILFLFDDRFRIIELEVY